MKFPEYYIAATTKIGDFEEHIKAPLMRKSFKLDTLPKKAELLICGLGFYELFLNGKRITKGHMAPYISNSDHLVYFDLYDVKKELTLGENVIGIILGNGMQNAFGGYVWDFEKAKFRSAPKLALSLELCYEGKKEPIVIDTSSGFKAHPSAITFNELRCGEFYDARLEINGWNKKDFDDSQWENAIKAETPRGTPKLCECEPIVVTKELSPLSIKQQGDAYLYDFGENAAGVTRLKIKGEKGQRIVLEHGEWLRQGKLDVSNFGKFFPENYSQRTEYICKGENEEVFTPHFTYYGFQYVLVHGITENQATKDLLTYLVMNTDLKEAGSFSCSDETANRLQDMTRRSTLANFYYFPTDCPHREKNGWTGDAAVSCEHTLLNLTPEKAYREWLNNIRKAQNEKGALPGIVPTGGWGYHWGNGPCWDQVLTTLPFLTYRYRGDKGILEENATAIFRYINYLDENLNAHGLIDFGLGDWLHVDKGGSGHLSPVEVTNSLMSMHIAQMAAFIFNELDMTLQRDFAKGLYNKLRGNIREYLIDFGTMTVKGRCQTSQAAAIFFGAFDQGEKAEAFKVLLKLIQEKNDHIDVGMVGLRVIFHVLSDFGYSDLAYKMITQETFPSYGHWVKLGFTSLPEEFKADYSDFGTSYNHHFFGDISAWFIKNITGINLNPHLNNVNEVKVTPCFIEKLTWAKGFHNAPLGKIEVSWKREGENILLSVNVPEGMTGEIRLPVGFVFEKGKSYMDLACFDELVCMPE